MQKNILLIAVLSLLWACGSQPYYYNQNKYNYPAPPVEEKKPEPEKPKIETVDIQRLGSEKTEKVELSQKTVEGVFVLIQKATRAKNLAILPSLCYRKDSLVVTVCDIDQRPTTWVKKFVADFSTGQITGETIYLSREAILKVAINNTISTPFQETLNVRMIKVGDSWYVKSLD